MLGQSPRVLGTAMDSCRSIKANFNPYQGAVAVGGLT